MVSRVLITGGAGFIGWNLSKFLLERSYHVTIIDNFATSRFSCTEALYNKLSSTTDDKMFNIIPHDFSNGHNIWRVEDHIESADIVIHLASSVGVKYVDAAPKYTLRNSLDINYSLFPILERYKKPTIFASTSEVYGNTKEAKESDTLQIGSPEVMRWGYACGKLMSEFLLKTYDIPCTIVRFFNVTGQDQIKKHGMVLPSLMYAALNNKTLTVYGDGEQFRSFCDIRDACVWLELLLNIDHTGEIFNIGNPENTITIFDLAKKVIINTESKSKISLVPYERDFSDQFGEIYQRKPNIDKISRYYAPKYNIDDIINSMKYE